MTRAIGALLVFVVVSWHAAQSQGTAVPAPPARAHHAIVYDAGAQRVLVAGGSTSTDGGETFKIFGDVWSFDGSRWRELGDFGTERSGVALAFDSKRRRVLAFGGFCPGCAGDEDLYADLLELRDGRWHPISEIPSRPTAESRMVYDSRRDRLVLYGGGGPASSRHSDTWEFDGAKWMRIDASGPGPRVDFAMAYDEARGRTVLFGGLGVPGAGASGETWEYDGSAWTRVATDGPSPRMSVSLVYDSKRKRSILFGNGTDTWSWDGTSWAKLADDGPPRRFMGALAYDAARDRVVLFGGRPGNPRPDVNDTWEWDGTSWKEIK